MRQYFTKKDKDFLIKEIKRTNPNNADDVFDLGKLLRDFGFRFMASVI